MNHKRLSRNEFNQLSEDEQAIYLERRLKRAAYMMSDYAGRLPGHPLTPFYNNSYGDMGRMEQFDYFTQLLDRAAKLLEDAPPAQWWPYEINVSASLSTLSSGQLPVVYG